MLMASSVSGWGPSCFASTVTLSSLMEPIARHRDEFYESLLETDARSACRTLVVGAADSPTPFGGARQHLNTYLARLRASQLEHVMLARLYAKMGVRRRQKINRIVFMSFGTHSSRIDCMLTSGIQHQQKGELAQASTSSRTFVNMSIVN